MKSGYNIEWAAEALNNLDSIIEYLHNRWTDRELSNFSKLLDKRINTISRNPHAFPASSLSPDIRRCVLSEQTTIYYEIN